MTNVSVRKDQKTSSHPAFAWKEERKEVLMLYKNQAVMARCQPCLCTCLIPVGIVVNLLEGVTVPLVIAVLPLRHAAARSE